MFYFSFGFRSSRGEAPDSEPLATSAGTTGPGPRENVSGSPISTGSLQPTATPTHPRRHRPSHPLGMPLPVPSRPPRHLGKRGQGQRQGPRPLLALRRLRPGSRRLPALRFRTPARPRSNQRHGRSGAGTVQQLDRPRPGYTSSSNQVRPGRNSMYSTTIPSSITNAARPKGGSPGSNGGSTTSAPSIAASRSSTA